MAICSDRAGWALALVLGAGCAEQVDPLCRAQEIGSEPQVYGGTEVALPWVVLLDSVPERAGSTGRILCTASLLSPRVVLTAAHCTIGARSFRVFAPFGMDQVATASRAFELESEEETRELVGEGTFDATHGFSDVAVVVLDQDLHVASYPTLAEGTAPWGTEVEAIGRRIDDQRALTATRASKLYRSAVVELGTPASDKSLFEELNDASSEQYTIGQKVVTQGDSGGPLVLAGTHEILGVGSAGSACAAVYARTDTLVEVLRAAIAAHPPTGRELRPCGELSEVGRCDEDVLRYCHEGALVELDCAPVTLCGEANGVADCVSPF